MLKTIVDLLYWKSPTPDENCQIWEIWQSQQPNSHFRTSDIYGLYISKRTDFIPISNEIDQQIIYCFGEFSSFISNGYSDMTVIQYLIVLMDLYDICKGSTRKILGDSDKISVLRNIVINRDISHLKSLNFNTYFYDYSKIHAHTVAQYSLSTLIYTFASNFLYYKGYNNCKKIDSTKCSSAYTKKLFGAANIAEKTVSISVPSKITTNEKIKSQSLPDNCDKILDNLFRCPTCTRMCENLWGNFSLCADCHTRRRCSICKDVASIITEDSLPKCNKCNKPTKNFL